MGRRKNNKPSTEEVVGDSVEQDAPKSDSVVVNQNEGGEATHGTTKEGDESPVKNTDKIPQNGVDSIETSEPAPNAVAEQADAERTDEEIQFADESNPNQKGRTTSAGGAEYDQDGNQRTDGYSYGVAPDDTRGVNEDSFKENVGEAPDDSEKFNGNPVHVADNRNGALNADDPNAELTEKEVEKLEKELSNTKEGVVARVVSSTQNFVKIKFFRDNKPFVIYKSRGKFDKSDAKAFLKDALGRE